MEVELHSSLQESISVKYSSLTRTQKRVAQYLLDNPSKVMSQDLESIARETCSSRSTVLRCIQELGFSGLKELQRWVTEPMGLGAESDMVSAWLYQSTLAAVRETYKTLDYTALDEAVARCQEASRLFWYGVGDSGFLVEMANHRCWLLGINSGVCTEEANLQSVSHTIDESQVLIMVSRSGNGHYLEKPLTIASQRNIFTIGITGSALSHLAEHCDIALIARSREATIQDRFIPIRAGQELVINALILKTAKALGIDFTMPDRYIPKPAT
ncbi:MAG: MurR/RpiR family transcriptional regulator [Firmicutes bacterium]|nr:MurR/RpiR family transcriptional regulator [Bacillota bacterium]